MIISATYSPEDDKIRLSASTRLPPETYERVKAAGFAWAPRQGVFYAVWSPRREDIATELAGEIGDEDTTLIERAEERADRFGDYSEARTADANTAYATARKIGDMIPLGQPILVGHHSEARHRRDIARIDANMGRACELWGKASYWTDRATSAIAHARYKELPAVRARRIKTLEAECRKYGRSKCEAETFLQLWAKPELTRDDASTIAGADDVSREFPLSEFPRGATADQYEGRQSLYMALKGNIIDETQAREIANRVHKRTIERVSRWISHLENRIAYEKTMLADQGGTVADRTKPEKGGAVRCLFAPRNGWAYIVKVNKTTVTIQEYYDYTQRCLGRNIPFDKLTDVMTAEAVTEARSRGLILEVPGRVGFTLIETPEAKPAT